MLLCDVLAVGWATPRRTGPEDAVKETEKLELIGLIDLISPGRTPPVKNFDVIATICYRSDDFMGAFLLTSLFEGRTIVPCKPSAGGLTQLS